MFTDIRQLFLIRMCLLTSKIDPERFRHVPIFSPTRSWKQHKAVIKIIYIYTIVPLILGNTIAARYAIVSWIISHAEKSRHAVSVDIAVASTTLKGQLR